MTTPSITLLHLPYSPWSERARWALEARDVPYRGRVYQPLLGEPELRLRLRRPLGPVTVPVLLTPDGPLADSFEIAGYADARGHGPALFPAGALPDITRWNALSEEGLAAGRALSLGRVLGDPEGLAELVPKGIRAALGPLARGVAAHGVRRSLGKYGAARASPAEHTAALRSVLDAIRQVLGEAPAGPGPRTLLTAGFTYADITAAQVLAFVTPPSTGLRIGRASRRAFTDTTLAAAYPDLLAWRDDLYARYRT